MTGHGKGRPAGDGAASKNPFVQADSTGAFAPLMWALKSAPLVTTAGGKLDQAAMLVLIHLATWANHNSLKAWPSVASVAERSGLTDETVRRALGRLAAAGLIVSDGVTESGTTRWVLCTELKRAELELTPAEQGRAKRREAAAARNRAYRARQRDALRERHAEPMDEPRDALGVRHVTHPEGVRDGVGPRHVTHWDAEERPVLERPLKNQELKDQPLRGGASPAARAEDIDVEHTSNDAPEAANVMASSPVSASSVVEFKDGHDEDEPAASQLASPGVSSQGEGIALPEPDSSPQGESKASAVPFAPAVATAVPAMPHPRIGARQATQQEEPYERLLAAIADRDAQACAYPAWQLAKKARPREPISERTTRQLYSNAFRGNERALDELECLGLPTPTPLDVMEASA